MELSAYLDHVRAHTLKNISAHQRVVNFPWHARNWLPPPAQAAF